MKYFFFSLLILLSCSTNIELDDFSFQNTCTTCPTIQKNQDTLDFVREVQSFVSINADMGVMDNSFCDTF